MKPPSSLFTILTAACLIIGLSCIFLLTPSSNRYQKAKANQAQWSADSDRRHQQDLAAASEAARLAEIRPKVLGLLPASNLQYDLVVQVEGLSRTLNLPLTSLTVSGPTSSGAAGAPKATTAAAAGPPSVSMSVSASGSYAQILSFVQALPTISRSVSISQIVVGTAVASTGSGSSPAVPSGQITVNITASANYQPSVDPKKP